MVLAYIWIVQGNIFSCQFDSTDCSCVWLGLSTVSKSHLHEMVQSNRFFSSSQTSFNQRYLLKESNGKIVKQRPTVVKKQEPSANFFFRFELKGKIKNRYMYFFCCFLDTVQWSLFNLFKNSRCLMFYLKIFFVIIYNCDKKNKIKLFVITTCFCCFLSARQAEITINAWYEILMIKWLTETHVRLAHTDVFASSAKNIANLISTIYYLYF